MLRKIAYLLFILLLASCGNSKTASVISNDGGGAAAVSSSETVQAPQATVQSVLAEASRGNYVEGELLVKFKKGVSSATATGVHQAVGTAGVLSRCSDLNIEHVALPAGVTVQNGIRQYMSDPNVEFAEPNYIRSLAATFPTDMYFGQQWALHNMGQFAAGRDDVDIDAPEAWDISRTTNVVIAVIDSGLDYNHADLVNNIWANTDENCVDGIDNDRNGYVDDCQGYDFTTCDLFDPNADTLVCLTPKTRDNDPMDDVGHGTHVAGIIGAVGHNGMGTSGLIWNVKIMPLKAFNTQSATSADLIAAVQYAIANGARIINASFGGPDFSNAEFSAYSSANTAGVLVMAAAGNEAVNNDQTPHYPANYNLSNIISVAASDQDERRAAFTNFGVNTVDVAAPGVYILSTVPWHGVHVPFVTMCHGAPFADFDFCDGTSMAAPHVAGLAGLLYSYYPTFTHSQVRAMIERYVDVLPEWIGWIRTGGRINAYRSLSALLTPTDLTATPVSTSSINLAWTDNATGEDSYAVERSSAGGPFVQIATLGADAADYSDSGLTASTTYSYRVRAMNTIPAESAYSNTATTTTLAEGARRSSGGGGGCSVGVRQSDIGSAADLAIMLVLPVVLIYVSRRLRKQ